MKNYLCFLIIILPNLIKAQDVIPIDSSIMKCFYLYEFKQDSSDINSVKSQEMVLQIGTQVSKFASQNMLFRDSLILKFNNEPLNQKTFDKIAPLVMGAPSHIYCRYRLYSNYPKKGNIQTRAYLNKTHVKTIENDPLNWSIEADRDSVISGYKCLKASVFFAGRKYNAWYTLEVPVSCGPYKFQGLPGLIVKISDERRQHAFTLTRLKQTNKKEAILFINEDFEEISSAEFVRMLNYDIAKLYSRINQEDGITPNNDESKATALNNLKARNNFIKKY